MLGYLVSAEALFQKECQYTRITGIPFWTLAPLPKQMTSRNYVTHRFYIIILSIFRLINTRISGLVTDSTDFTPNSTPAEAWGTAHMAINNEL